VISRLNVGGPARHVVWLTEALDANGFEAVLVTGSVPPGEADMSDFAARHGVVPLVIPEMSREISAADVVTVWKLYQLFRRLRPDVIHTHAAKAGAAGRAAGFVYRWLAPGTLVGRPRRVHFVHTYHGHIFHSYYGGLKTRFFLTIERLLARMTDRIVVLGPQQLHEIHEVFGVGRREQFRIVPLGLGLEETRGDRAAGAALRRELGIADDEVVAGIVGRLTAIKNHALFIRVAARVAAERPSVRFVVYGDGGDRAALESRAASEAPGSRIVFAGTRDARTIYGSLDLTVLTSLNEGTPLTLIEAMANEKPVVSTAVGGVVDLLGPVEEACGGFEIRERGVSAASNDEAGLAAGLLRLLDDRELAGRLARRGREQVERIYAKDRLVTDIIALTRELAG
jgi:glycosyltransferase involved in cell wall biosynthesis